MSVNDYLGLYRMQKDKISNLILNYKELINNPLDATLKQLFDCINSQYELILSLEKTLDKIFSDNTNSMNNSMISAYSQRDPSVKAKSSIFDNSPKISNLKINKSINKSNNPSKTNLIPNSRSKSKNERKGPNNSQNINRRNVMTSLGNSQSQRDLRKYSKSPQWANTRNEEVILLPDGKKRKFGISPSPLGMQLLESSYKVLGKYNEQSRKKEMEEQ
ncbi:MAG: hypothetical protein MJ252_01560 [archaeon]|nr:hypothetical protein [archaeon]